MPGEQLCHLINLKSKEKRAGLTAAWNGNGGVAVHGPGWEAKFYQRAGNIFTLVSARGDLRHSELSGSHVGILYTEHSVLLTLGLARRGES